MSEDQEEWRPVVGWEGVYEVSSLGRVRSIDRVLRRRNRWGTFTDRIDVGKVLRFDRDRAGYVRVSLSREGHVQTFKVHHIVCSSFHGTAPCGYEVAHGNGVRDDNRPANLRWATKVQNAADRKLHGTETEGEQNGMAVLTEDAVIAIRRSSMTRQQLADAYCVAAVTIKQVRRRRSWKHVD